MSLRQHPCYKEHTQTKTSSRLHQSNISARKTREDLLSKYPSPWNAIHRWLCAYTLVAGFEESDSDIDGFLNVESVVPTSQDQLSGSNPVPRWRRYGTHPKTAAIFKLSVFDECRICCGIRYAVSIFSWSDLENARGFDTGFTTCGVYYFPESTTSRIIFN